MPRALRGHAENVEPLTCAARQRLTASLRFGPLLHDFTFLMAKDLIPAPRFPPVFSRGDNCPHCATYWLPRICAKTQLTLKIAGQSFLCRQLPERRAAHSLAQNGGMAPETRLLDELVILRMAKVETDPLPNNQGSGVCVVSGYDA
jgi:hypothetical protein